jgi:hypothetical protein
MDFPLHALLLAQAAVGGADTLLNHELVARLPHRPEARREIGLHAVREAIYGTLFLGLAFFAWQGAFAWAIAGLLAAEIVVTTTDEWIENRTRLLPQNERVLHVLLTLNLGLIIAVLLPRLLDWSSQATRLVRLEAGWAAWLLAAFGAASFAWCVRDALAWRRLPKAQ